MTARRGTVAYQLDLPKELLDVHDVFHVSQLRKCVSSPEKHVPHESIDMQPDLTYRERPIKILEESERRTRQKTIKFFKVQWSNHTEDEISGTRFFKVQWSNMGKRGFSSGRVPPPI